MSSLVAGELRLLGSATSPGRESGDLNTAIQAYTKTLKIALSHWGYLLLARALAQEGRQQEAQAATQRTKAVSENIEQAQRTGLGSGLAPFLGGIDILGDGEIEAITAGFPVVGMLTYNVWNNVSFLFDINTQTYSLSLNGVVLGSNVPFCGKQSDSLGPERRWRNHVQLSSSKRTRKFVVIAHLREVREPSSRANSTQIPIAPQNSATLSAVSRRNHLNLLLQRMALELHSSYTKVPLVGP